jgi:hypothetical protein
MPWHSMAWHGMAWHDTTRHDTTRHDMTYLLTAIGLTPDDSSAVHIYTKTEQNNVTEYPGWNIHNKKNT